MLFEFLAMTNRTNIGNGDTFPSTQNVFLEYCTMLPKQIQKLTLPVFVNNNAEYAPHVIRPEHITHMLHSGPLLPCHPRYMDYRGLFML